MKLTYNFKIDLLTGAEFPMKELRYELLRIGNKVGKTCYNSEVSNLYHVRKYGKTLVEMLFELGVDMPICPITKSYVSHKLQGSIVFGKYSPFCTSQQIAEHVAKNNASFKSHVERMKKTRKGDGNPMFQKKAWNKELTKENNERLKTMSDNRKGIVFSDETLSKMSNSAKVRSVHGHTGHKHSEATKALLRNKTIERHKSGKYPKTKTTPHNKVKEWLNEFGFKYDEEFSFEGFVFDFKVGNTLVEVQGDFFHCNPNTRHKTPKSEIQKKNVLRDERKRATVADSNFLLLELWENDIIHDEANTKSKVACLKN